MLSLNIIQPEQADSFLASCLVASQVDTSVSCLQLSQSCSQQELFLLYYMSKMKCSLFSRSLNLILKFYDAEKHQRAFCKYTY